MSQKLVSLNEDLSRLRADGYHIAVGKSGHLLVRDVPYVNDKKEVKKGTIAMALDLAGEATVAPSSHVVFFVGDYPCDVSGAALPGVSPNTNHQMGEGLTPNHQISRKPMAGPTPGSYPNYFEKVKTLVEIVSAPARYIDSTVTALTHPVVIEEEAGSLFNYVDTAATKAGLVIANRKLEGEKVAIIGVGGTGSYVLDLVAKTPAAEIHIFDQDVFLNHNAFKCPGAPAVSDLALKPQKVDYLASIYSRMRKQIFAHNRVVDESCIELLKGFSFVFICIDKGGAKELIVNRLEEWNIPFIDVGMGLQLGDDNSLGGIVTVTTNTPGKRDHFRKRVPFVDGTAENEYSRNVQIADLSALNAALAVIKWKKLKGYYDDSTKEHWTAYTIRTNQLISEDTND